MKDTRDDRIVISAWLQPQALERLDDCRSRIAAPHPFGVNCDKSKMPSFFSIVATRSTIFRSAGCTENAAR
jgi:hypothetical protein